MSDNKTILYEHQMKPKLTGSHGYPAGWEQPNTHQLLKY